MFRSLRVWFSLELVARAFGGTRVEKDKTPYPCKDKYDEVDISKWVEKHLGGVRMGQTQPRLLLMLGGSGAGKGTFVKEWDQAGRDAADWAFHGLDEYLPYIPEYMQSIQDTANVYKDAADACYSPAAIPAAKLAGAHIVDKKMNLIYEETGKNVDRIKKRVLPQFVDAGYLVTLVLVHNKADVAMKRSVGRFQETGRYADVDYIQGTFKNNFESYTELKSAKNVVEAIYCDNSGASLKCWEDVVSGERIIPKSMLLEGSPQFMQPGGKTEL